MGWFRKKERKLQTVDDVYQAMRRHRSPCVYAEDGMRAAFSHAHCTCGFDQFWLSISEQVRDYFGRGSSDSAPPNAPPQMNRLSIETARQILREGEQVCQAKDVAVLERYYAAAMNQGLQFAEQLGRSERDFAKARELLWQAYVFAWNCAEDKGQPDAFRAKAMAWVASVVDLVGDARNPKPRPLDEAQRQMASTT